MPKQVHQQDWVKGFRATLKTVCGRGWSVQEDNGSIRLNVRTPAVQGQCSLGLRWEMSSVPLALKRVEKIQALVAAGKSVSEAGRISSSTDQEGRCDWQKALADFKNYKISKGTRGKPIGEETWADNYARPLNRAVELLSSGAPNGAYDLIEEVIEPWEDKARQREIFVNSTDAFLGHCIRFHGLDAGVWTLHADEKSELKGPGSAQRRKAVMNKQQMLALLDSFGSRKEALLWREAIKTMIVFGLRPIELNYLEWRPWPGHSQLLPYCSYEKPSGRYKTKPRFLAPCYLDGVHWEDLVLDFPLLAKSRLNRFLSNQPHWQELRREFEARGEWLRPYVFRDSYSYRCHQEKRALNLICSAMGHSLATHQRYYEWGRENAVIEAALAAAS